MAPPRKRGRPRRKGEPINLRLKPGLKRRFADEVATIRPETTVTSVMEMLIEDWLAARERERKASPGVPPPQL